MTGYIQSKDNIKDRLGIGPYELSLFPLTPEQCQSLPLYGSYSIVNGVRVFLYRWDGRLRFRVGKSPPMDADQVQIDWRVQDCQIFFRVLRHSEVLLEGTHALPPDIERIKDDPTPFVEAEDFDFVLFVRNVLLDPARARRMYTAS